MSQQHANSQASPSTTANGKHHPAAEDPVIGFAPFPESRKVYVTGSRADVRVPMREIAQQATPASFGSARNER